MKITTFAEIKARMIAEQKEAPKPVTKSERAKAFVTKVRRYQKSKVKAVKRTNNEYHDKYGELI